MVETIGFWMCAVMSVIGALVMITHRSIIYSALSLIVVFMAVAGVFLLNNADFLAVSQIIVYAVGMTIILLFGIMFTGEQMKLQRIVSKRRLVAYGSIIVFFVALLAYAVTTYHYPLMQIPAQIVQRLKLEGTTQMLGEQLFSVYVLPFELVSVLLLMAMIGAIVLSKKTFTDAPTSLRFEIDQESVLSAEAEGWEQKVKGPLATEAPAPPAAAPAETRELAGVK